MKILWITNIPSPYRVDFFNKIGQRCELTVLFERGNAENRDPSWENFHFKNFKGRIMNGFSLSADSAMCIEVLSHLIRNSYDKVVITNFSSPTGAIAIAYLKMTQQPYYLESDGGFASKGSLKALLKKLVIKGALGYFSTSDIHDEYYKAYGAQPNQLIRYPFSSIHNNEVLGSLPSEETKHLAKQSLGISESKLVLSIGQFIERKGFDILLQSCALLDKDTVVYIIGGVPTPEYLKIIDDLGLDNVRFEDFKEPGELHQYFLAADVFVLPTRQDIWGLVINEALGHALPVITTNRCIAGLELIPKNKCGLIVPVNDVEALANAIKIILNNANSQVEMANNALRLSKKYTIEQMVDRHIEVFEQNIQNN